MQPVAVSRRRLRALTLVIAGFACAPLLFVALAEEMPRRQRDARALSLSTSLPTDTRDAEAQMRIAAGGAVFRKIWVSAPSSTTSSDGLGPLYNARSCAQCHEGGGRGRPFATAVATSDSPVEAAAPLVMRLSVPPASTLERSALADRHVRAIPEPTYGQQLQPLAIQGHAGEGRVTIETTNVPVLLSGGEVVMLRRPAYRITAPGYGAFHPDLMMSPRLAPQLVGMGLLDAVSDAEILAGEDPDDRDGDGIRGRANRVRDEAGVVRIGRFGWKATAASLAQQVAEALANDLGLSSPLIDRPFGDCSPRQDICRKAPNGRSDRHGGHEVGPEMLELLTAFTASLSLPPRREMDDAKIKAGEQLFQQVGCAVCHRPRLETSPIALRAEHRGRVIWPYTDLLLHDMGDDLADGRPDGDASGRDWRTPPLWGLGWLEAKNSDIRLLHDGRARSIEEAVLWHGGEARRARDAFAALDAAERQALVRFVKSL